MTRSVEQNVERNAFIQIAGSDRFSVRSQNRPGARLNDWCRLVARERGSRWRIKRSLAPARRQAERRDQRADQSDAKKPTVKMRQDGYSLRPTITKQANKAKSGFLFFQLA